MTEDTFVEFTYVPVLRAVMALKRRKPADAVGRLQVALPYELAVNGLNFTHFYLGGLHSPTCAARLLQQLIDMQKRQLNFRILDHRSIVGLDPIGALAHLQLGRVFALSGDKTKAKAAYDAFLTPWKDADPDVPILKSAKAEYKKL